MKPEHARLPGTTPSRELPLVPTNSGIQMSTAQREKFAKLSDQILHMSIVLGDDSDADLEEWRDLDSCLSEARMLKFKEKKDSLNKATVSSSGSPRPSMLTDCHKNESCERSRVPEMIGKVILLKSEHQGAGPSPVRGVPAPGRRQGCLFGVSSGGLLLPSQLH